MLYFHDHSCGKGRFAPYTLFTRTPSVIDWVPFGFCVWMLSRAIRRRGLYNTPTLVRRVPLEFWDVCVGSVESPAELCPLLDHPSRRTSTEARIWADYYRWRGRRWKHRSYVWFGVKPRVVYEFELRFRIRNSCLNPRKYYTNLLHVLVITYKASLCTQFCKRLCIQTPEAPHTFCKQLKSHHCRACRTSWWISWVRLGWTLRILIQFSDRTARRVPFRR